ncbi:MULTISPECIES: OmpP1/FadL family transporter [unclassified Saccharicrinis]|uniref:OmpP1/FadL family transporter n=1 Tax=unclassified Saccharicrinis TaxID=2646859 RepID=UPI003D33A68A
MNNIKHLTALLLSFIVLSLNAQNYEDMLRYSQPQYSGTARTMAMGNAFASVGGDYGSLAINPAGIGVYRSSEFTFTPSVIMNSTSSTFLDNKTDETKLSFAPSQIGFVGTYKPMRDVKKGLVSSHFAIGYTRNNNFNYKSLAAARNTSQSLGGYFEHNANDADGYWSQLTSLAFDAYIIDEIDDGNGGSYYSSFMNPGDMVHQTNILEKEGYSGEINLTGGVNISNFLMVGGSVNIVTMRYKEEANYYEEYSLDNGQVNSYDVFDRFSVRNYLDVSGVGVNLKAGFILKPVNFFRIGAAYHTPTWYNIEEEFGTGIDAVFFNDIDAVGGNSTYAYDYENVFEYKVITPEKLVAGASFVIGKFAILSADYEYIDYANGKFKTNSTNYEDILAIRDASDALKYDLTSTHNFRAGAEFKLGKQVSLRGGYSWQESPYKVGEKDREITSYSAGLGFRNKNYFIDLAYKLSSFDNRFFNYNWDAEYDQDLGVPYETVAKTNDHFVALTMGWKF